MSFIYYTLSQDTKSNLSLKGYVYFLEGRNVNISITDISINVQRMFPLSGVCTGCLAGVLGGVLSPEGKSGFSVLRGQNPWCDTGAVLWSLRARCLPREAVAGTMTALPPSPLLAQPSGPR